MRDSDTRRTTYPRFRWRERRSRRQRRIVGGTERDNDETPDLKRPPLTLTHKEPHNAAISPYLDQRHP
jgi:hypothetical protein